MNRPEPLLRNADTPAIGHPFRQSLPVEMIHLAHTEQMVEAATSPRSKALGDDASLFLLSFIAFFTAFYTFIF